METDPALNFVFSKRTRQWPTRVVKRELQCEAAARGTAEPRARWGRRPGPPRRGGGRGRGARGRGQGRGSHGTQRSLEPRGAARVQNTLWQRLKRVSENAFCPDALLAEDRKTPGVADAALEDHDPAPRPCCSSFFFQSSVSLRCCANGTLLERHTTERHASLPLRCPSSLCGGVCCRVPFAIPFSGGVCCRLVTPSVAACRFVSFVKVSALRLHDA